VGADVGVVVLHISARGFDGGRLHAHLLRQALALAQPRLVRAQPSHRARSGNAPLLNPTHYSSCIHTDEHGMQEHVVPCKRAMP
jgi:hypothetical protein